MFCVLVWLPPCSNSCKGNYQIHGYVRVQAFCHTLPTHSSDRKWQKYIFLQVGYESRQWFSERKAMRKNCHWLSEAPVYLDFGGSWQEEDGFIEKTKTCQEKLEEKQEGWIFKI